MSEDTVREALRELSDAECREIAMRVLLIPKWRFDHPTDTVEIRLEEITRAIRAGHAAALREDRGTDLTECPGCCLIFPAIQSDVRDRIESLERARRECGHCGANLVCEYDRKHDITDAAPIPEDRAKGEGEHIHTRQCLARGCSISSWQWDMRIDTTPSTSSTT